MSAVRHDAGVYERAESIVDRALSVELEADVRARLCRAVGHERAQIATLRAIIQVAGNLLARLAGGAEAERFHRERATHYAIAAARAPARWGAKR
jgi:hypothetical protein